MERKKLIQMLADAHLCDEAWWVIIVISVAALICFAM